MTDVLTVPPKLYDNWTAPAGTYRWPGQVQLAKPGIGVDLSPCSLITDPTQGYHGYLFKPTPGPGEFTIELGNVVDYAGILLAQLGVTNARAAVRILGGYLNNVRDIVNVKTKDGGRVDALAEYVTAIGIAVGVRTYGAARLVDSQLKSGGATTPYGEPTACRALDLNDTGTVVDDQVLHILRCLITGFTAGSNPDGGGGEETVAEARIEDSTFDTAGDALLDLKVALAYVLDNVFGGTVGGNRMIAVHAGRAYLARNRFDIPAGAAAIQATGTVISDGDTFNDLDQPGALAAKATVALQGSTGFPDDGVRVGHVELWNPQPDAATSAAAVKVVPSDKDGVTYTPTIEIH
jgi:hypothetical protein